MNLRLALAERFLPLPFRKRELLSLFELTAEAFEAPLPALKGKTFDEMLGAYARWTNEQAARTAEDESRAAAARARLRDLAFAYGGRIRKRLGLRTRRQAARAGRLLYRLIRIDFQETEAGEILVRRCYFSRIYAPQTCALMAGLDEGILAGLSGGGRLEFSSRITENDLACRGRFTFPEDLL